MKNLTNDRWSQIDNLFREVLEESAENRQRVLHDICGTDVQLREQIEKLLEVHEEAERILGDSIDKFAAPLIPGLLEEVEEGVTEKSETGTQIGSYQLLERIGRGGMGTVYRARKTGAPYEKEVALKLVRKGMNSKDILRRFRNEGQILASLEHPNIARLYDGGIHVDGRPYFVMEYVEGEPIDVYCDKQKLSVPKRLKLFQRVCDAVQFAHRNLVVHRDIKPANVLITRKGTVKLVDFGIAKLLEPGGSRVQTIQTRPGMKLLTPEFASPEQIQERVIATATDIYSLGILLYLLLTGRKPYSFESTSMLEIERIVCESEPIRPSEAAMGAPLPSPGIHETTFDPNHSAQLRSKTSDNLAKELRGDLDRIVLKALRKEPEQRYRSVLEFSEDLDNYFHGRPIVARPATFQYRAKKFIRRNRWRVISAAVTVLTILSALGVAIWQGNIARTERDIAQNEAAKAKATQDYLVNLFEAADPAQSRGEEITVRELVERGIEQLDDNLAHEPEVHTEMLKVLGRVEMALGDYNQSAELLEEAFHKIRNIQGVDNINYATVAALLGESMRRLGNYDRADSLLRDAIAIRSRYVERDDEEIAWNMNRLASVQIFKGNFDEAELLYDQSLEMRRRLFGDQSNEVAENLNNMGWLYHQTGNLDKAETALRKSLMVREQLYESPHPVIASTTNNLAGVLRSKGNLSEAEFYFKRALEQEQALHGDDHPRVTTAMSNLSLLHLDMARYKEAAVQYQEILEKNRQQLGPDHLYVGLALMRLSTALLEDGKSDEALFHIDEMLGIFRSKVGDRHRYVALGLMVKADALYYSDPVQSIHTIQQVKRIFDEISEQEQPEYAEALTRLGRAQLATGKLDSAVVTLREALLIQERTLPESHPNKVWTLINLGRALTENGQPEEAEPLLQQAVEMSEELLPPEHWRRMTAHLEWAACLKATGDQPRSLTELERVMAQLDGRTDFHAGSLWARAEEIGI